MPSGSTLGHRARRQHRSGAGLVLDDGRNAGGARDFVGNGAHEDVWHCSCRERHHKR
jgi:hypothetical protein